MTLAPDAGIGTRSVPFARNLAAHGDRTALITPDEEITYQDLADRVAHLAEQFRSPGGTRKLVMIAAGNTTDTVIAYLAALAGGHVALLAPGDRASTVDNTVKTYDPDILVLAEQGTRQVQHRHRPGRHPLHPDLALLLSTSGTTGGTKLVRLSHDNLQANAESIAEYLGIRADDRAATTLPLHYCYGLSVLNSHLHRGAALILTDRSVSDDAFWHLFRERRGTTFAGVPYTFDLLDRVGFEHMDLPHLRYITQAGGRLAPARVRQYAELGRRHGFDLFVMYGQTEATARMAYLPPDLAAAHPDCIGVPIPGGSFALEPLAGAPEDAGELVYTGPNVMLGYARRPADLALGREVERLRTGDIATVTDDGLYRLLGRRARFAKVYGLRIDLDEVERALTERGLTAHCVGHEDALGLVLTGVGTPARARREAARVTGLPERSVRVRQVSAPPRLPNGKIDYPALAALTEPDEAGEGGGAGGGVTSAPPPTPPRGHADLVALYADVLGARGVTPDSTFITLGGDSLSYVEMSVRLERALGHLPAGWHAMPIRELRPAPRVTARLRSRVDTSVALRAIAIVLIVGTHAKLFSVPGGAHLLLGIAGFNLARFHLGRADRRERTAGMRRGIGRIALACMTWIGLVVLFTDQYSVTQALLLNYLFGPKGHNDFWFIETLVYITLALMLLFGTATVDALERRAPFALPMVLTALALPLRYDLLPGAPLPTPLRAFWLFGLGWAAAKATTTWQRVAVTIAILATIPGFHGGDPVREAVMMGGLALLVWFPTLPSTAALNRIAAALAGASLYIYLTHWQVFPHLPGNLAVLAWIGSLAVGVAYAMAARRAGTGLTALLRRARATLTRL